MDDRAAMILQLQQVGFSLVELNLYLNTHPMDRAALMNYNTLHDQFQKLMMQYNMTYGPLMGFGHAPGGTEQFLWVNSPWPWQKDANMASYRG